MTWFKVDDTLHAHKKAMRAGCEAMGLWVLAGSWAADQLTDGWVPEYAALRLVPEASQLAERLVRAGLWEEGEYDGDKGWWFHQWKERQPERADVVADRAANARKSSLYRDQDLVGAIRKRDRDRCRYCGTLINWRDRRSACGATFDHVETPGLNTLENVVVACRGCNARKAGEPLSTTGMALLEPGAIGVGAGANLSASSTGTDSAGSHLDTDQNGTSTYLDRDGIFQVPDPSRPVPTRPDPGLPTEDPDTDSSSGPARRKPETLIPDTWRPNDKHHAYAVEHGLDVDVQRQLFTANAESNDRRCRSWNGAFSQWLIKAVQFEHSRQQKRPHLQAVSGDSRYGQKHQTYRNPPESAYDEPMYPEEGR